MAQLADGADAAAPKSLVYRGTFVCSQVSIKRVCADAIDGAALDHSLELYGEGERVKTASGLYQHVVAMLTSQYLETSGVLHYYIVMERCEHNLQEFVRSAAAAAPVDRPSFADLVAIALQVCKGVAFLHTMTIPWRRGASGVYHGNLKPSNVLFRNGIVKLAEIRSAGAAGTGAGSGAGSDAAPSAGNIAGAVAKPSQDEARLAAAAGDGAASSVDCGCSDVDADGGGSGVVDTTRPGNGLVVSTASEAARAMDNAVGWRCARANAAADSSADEMSMQSDLFALGCLVHYTLTLGRHPYDPLPRRADKSRRMRAPSLSMLQDSPAAQHLVGCLMGFCTCGSSAGLWCVHGAALLLLLVRLLGPTRVCNGACGTCTNLLRVSPGVPSAS
jgi:serine/threonine protein kinase